MNHAKLFSLSLVLAMLLSMPGVLAFGCNPESKDCLGNAPAGVIVQGHGNWLLDFIASLTKGLSVSGTSTTTEITYTYSDVLRPPSGEEDWVCTGPFAYCSLFVYCGSNAPVQKIAISAFNTGVTLSSAPKCVFSTPSSYYNSMSQTFSCKCGYTGEVQVRLICGINPYGTDEYYTAWSKTPVVACAVPTPTPIPTTQPCWQPPMVWTLTSVPCGGVQTSTPTPCPIAWSPPTCVGNAIKVVSNSCGGSSEKITPCESWQNCMNGQCFNLEQGGITTPTAVPTGTPLVTVTSTPDVYGNCPPLPRADCITLGLSGGCPLYQCPQVQPPAAGFDLSQLSTYHVIGLLLLVFLGAMYLKKGRK